mgnify:CR=1 FL=1
MNALAEILGLVTLILGAVGATMIGRTLLSSSWSDDERTALALGLAFMLMGENSRAVAQAVAEMGLPFLGLCLGHQLLACALGGACGPSRVPEIGVMDVILTEEGVASTFFDGVDSPMKALQWHSAEVTQLPENAKVLATSPECAVQAMSWGPRALSMQFHMEVEADTCANWAEIPEYAGALENALGPDGLARITAACTAEMAAFNRDAERVYINWLQAAAQV